MSADAVAEQPFCSGVPYTTTRPDLITAGVVDLMLEHGLRCGVCGDWVRRWRLERSRLRHRRTGDPGE